MPAAVIDPPQGSRPSEIHKTLQAELNPKRPECRLGSLMLMVDYRYSINLDIFFAFCPVLYEGDPMNPGDVLSVKKGKSHRGLILRNSSGFPYSLTLDVLVGQKNVNVALWQKEKQHPETGELLCKGKICGTSEIPVAEKALELIFDKVEWVQHKIEMLQEDPERTDSFLVWLKENLQISDDPWESQLEYRNPPPAEFGELAQFVQTYFRDEVEPGALISPSTLIDGLEWLCAQTAISEKSPEIVHLWPCMFKVTFKINFVIDYARLRNTINDLFINGFQKDFYVMYCESHNPNCVIHGRCDDSPDDHIYTYRLGAKARDGYTNVTLVSPGFDPSQSIAKFYQLINKNHFSISVSESI